MKRYQVMLHSRDRQKFEYECWADCLGSAEIKALEHLIEIGYSIYDYRVLWSKEINKPEINSD